MYVLPCSRTSSFWKQTAIDAWKEQRLAAEGASSTSITSEDAMLEPDLESEVTSTAAPLSALETLSSLASGLSGQESLSDKEIKKIAFSLCQERYELVLGVATQLVELETALGEEVESGRGDRRGGKKKSGGGGGGGEKSGKKR
jgi:hypothetical protein